MKEINCPKTKMELFGCCLLLMSCVTGSMKSMVGIRTKTFNKMNCKDGSLSILPSYTTVKRRSSLGCAFECTKSTCMSYKYDEDTSECQLSYGALDGETDDLFCAPINTDSLGNTDCSPPFQSFCDLCITHIRQTRPYSTYADLQNECTTIDGQLFRIEEYQFHKKSCLKIYSFENNLQNYGIQGQRTITLWLTDDGLIAGGPTMIFGDILAVRGISLLETGIDIADVVTCTCIGALHVKQFLQSAIAPHSEVHVTSENNLRNSALQGQQLGGFLSTWYNDDGNIAAYMYMDQPFITMTHSSSQQF